MVEGRHAPASTGTGPCSGTDVVELSSRSRRTAHAVGELWRPPHVSLPAATSSSMEKSSQVNIHWSVDSRFAQ